MTLAFVIHFSIDTMLKSSIIKYNQELWVANSWRENDINF